MNQDLLLVSSTLYFLNDFWNYQKAFDENKNLGKGVREDSLPGRIQPAPLLQTQPFHQKNVTDCAFHYYTIIQLLTIVFSSVNKWTN